MSVVLDSSAIMALILGEPGGEVVVSHLHDAVTSTVMLAEVYGYAARNGHPFDAYGAFFHSSRIEVVPLGSGEAEFAGRLVATTRTAGLSLGDRCCLALARSRDIAVLTADRRWAEFAALLGLNITLIR